MLLDHSLSFSRDRLSFSKSILRRFIRDCVDRDAAVASPWTVKPLIAKHYGVSSIMPEETRKGVEDIKRGEIDKRKKVWEDREGPPTKKHKKLTAAREEKGVLTSFYLTPSIKPIALGSWKKGTRSSRNSGEGENGERGRAYSC
jgi:hypothetical protein